MTTTTQPQVKILTRLPADLHREIRHMAIDLGTSMQQLVLGAVQEWLEAQKGDGKR